MSKKITIEEIVKKFGVDVNNLEIVERMPKPLGEYDRKETITLGDREYIVCGHLPDGRTMLMTKEFYLENTQFDEDTPNLANASIKEELSPLFDELKEIVGEDNICKHTVDLTTLNGMKDNGTCEAYISIPTFDFARENIDIFIDYKKCVDDWQWLANAWATEDTGYKYGVSVLSPGCNFNYYDCSIHCGARAFCILKSDILVS